MNEKNQIVDNPLLLTSLFSEGIFYIPSDKTVRQEIDVVAKNQQVEDDVLPKTGEGIIENITENVEIIKKIELPQSVVINIIIDSEKAHWPAKLSEPLTRMMAAIKIDGVSLNLSDFAVYNLIMFPEVSDISKFILELNTNRVIIWSTQLKIENFPQINAEYTVANKQVLWLKDILDVMANTENKMEAWVSMKKFFKM